MTSPRPATTGVRSGRASSRWRQLVDGQLRALQHRIEQMEAARQFLEHVVSHHDSAPDGCAHYERLIWDRPASPGHHNSG